ncbi:MAG: saccharopine dehydrogenase NADP-binding domain-containing protein [Cytophagales bacterium]|nr:saccharopine dehydrogenase NADP-binding domain-containing protein [Cytophagales bacterium]
MQVLLLGAGSMGRWAAQTAVTFATVSRLTIADRACMAAEVVAKQCGPKAQALKLDVTDRPALLAAMQQHQVVLNCVGPYYRFGLSTLQAAIEAGCHYLDLCDDWQPTLQMLALNEMAQQAGITAVIGLGASPGISNLLALKLARTLGHVRQLHTGWRVESAMEQEETEAVNRSQAAVEHWIHQFTGRIVLHEGGVQQMKAPLEPVTLPFPGVGARTFYTLGHPEAVTLPRALPQLQESKNLMHLHAPTLQAIAALAAEVNRGALSVEGAAARLIQQQQANPAGEAQVSAGAGDVPSLFAWGEGLLRGQVVRGAIGIRAYPPGGMGGMTGIPLAVGLCLLSKGRLTKRGVFSPEEAFDPDEFLAEFAHYCTCPAPVAAERLVYLITSGV